MSANYKQAGAEAWRAFRDSDQFRQFDRDTPAEDAIRLFLPPENEDMMQVSRPLSKARRDWITGFNEARIASA